VAADNAVAAIHVVLDVKRCMEPPLPFEQPVLLPKSSAIMASADMPPSQGVPVVTIRGQDIIFFEVQCGNRTDVPLLGNIEVAETAYFLKAYIWADFSSALRNEQHLLEEIEEKLAVIIA
jgi:hypothetical protein